MPRRNHRKEKRAPEKGKEIRFIRGSYEGCIGWLDKANKSKKKSKMVHVIIVDDDEECDEEVHTKVWRSSFCERHKAPTTWAQAAVQQHPEIEKAVIEAAKLFASCIIADEKSVMDYFAFEIERAQKENADQAKKTIRAVEFHLV
jgi:hypothetical protein